MGSNGGGNGKNDGNAGVDQHAVANAFRLRRANQLATSKKRWERRRDAKTGQMRWFNDTLIEVEGASTAGTDASEKQGGTPSAAPERAFVRQISADGVLSWVPASEATVASGVEGTMIDSHDLEGAASLQFDQKIAWFQDTVGKLRVERSSGVVKVAVRRDQLMDSTFQIFRNMKPGDFKRSLFFEFQDEKGLDYGGVAREVFSLLFNDLFNVDFALFKLSSNNSYSINENSTNINEHSLEYFTFVGQVLGKAMFDGHVCQHHLSLPLFKHLLAWPCGLTDLEYVDDMLASSLRQLMALQSEEEVEGSYLTFSTTTNYFGVTETVALKPNGENINVTMENRDEYGHLLIKYYLLDRVKSQLAAMLHGFYMIIPQSLISVFDFQELELLCCGLTHVDIDDWRRNTNYQHEYAALGERHPVIVWFWECVMEFDDATRCRLLQFVTGSSRVPVSGFGGLQGNDGNVKKFTIDSVSTKVALFPRAHTCFNRLDLPNFLELGSVDDLGRGKLKETLTKVLHMALVGFDSE